ARTPGPGKRIGRPKKLLSTPAPVIAQPEPQLSLLSARVRPEHKLSDAQRLTLIDKQGGRCAACKEQFNGTPCSDHSHSTGKFRALLCHACNTVLGFARESPGRLRARALYLGAHG